MDNIVFLILFCIFSHGGNYFGYYVDSRIFKLFYRDKAGLREPVKTFLNASELAKAKEMPHFPGT